MTKRDVIIVAVLVNAGLLAILFMMAITSDEDRVSDPTEITTSIVEVPVEIPQDPVQISTSDASPVASLDHRHPEAFVEIATPMPIIVDDDNDLDQDDEMHNTADVALEQHQKPTISENTPSKPIASTSPTSSSSSTSNQKVVDITVKRGDSLDKIARANGTTIKAIKEANQLKSDKLNIGQVLHVPVGSGSGSAKESKETKASAAAKPTQTKSSSKDKASVAQGDQQHYTIKNGDNPWKIAKQFNLKLPELLKLNNLDEESARNLQVGDKIRVR